MLYNSRRYNIKLSKKTIAIEVIKVGDTQGLEKMPSCSGDDLNKLFSKK
jgi:hypothetical protein